VFCRTNQLAYSMSNALVMNEPSSIADAFIVQYILQFILCSLRDSREIMSLWLILVLFCIFSSGCCPCILLSLQIFIIVTLKSFFFFLGKEDLAY